MKQENLKFKNFRLFSIVDNQSADNYHQYYRVRNF